ncbi:hypothetical protein DM860_001945 [Cuscuta australis]|uniref:Uncharacterized protein n=1 Tax=Cuscuta australis TaxID=267555 RepID=A0A328DVC6_9ASTE|nr:hypothetical protein DM860_001945 [Cuscuta australis]
MVTEHDPTNLRDSKSPSILSSVKLRFAALPHIEIPFIHSITSDGFWAKVTDKFLELMHASESYRLVHSVASKYRDMNKKIQKFSSIYNNIYMNRASGSSDQDVLQQALEKCRA